MSNEDQENENANGSGSPSSGVNNDVKPETHFADDKGVPYYNRFRELEEKFGKFKDVDLDLYNRAKELDFDELEESFQLKQQIYSDPDKLAKVLAILKGEIEKPKNEPTKGEGNQELRQVLDRLHALEGHFKRQSQSDWMQKFDASFEQSLGDFLKAEDFKELGGKLSEFEKRALSKLVDDTFQADQSKGNLAKLSLKDVPNVLRDVLKMVLDHRRSSGGKVKNDQSPQPINGAGGSGQHKPKPLNEEERINAMQNYMKEAEAAKIPVS